MIKNILSDRLNKRIEIQENTTTSDGFGGFTNSWTKLKEIWAEIKPINIYNTFEANKVQEKISHIITIRYCSELTINHRIKYQNRIFNIQGIINPLEKNKIMEIETEEIF